MLDAGVSLRDVQIALVAMIKSASAVSDVK
jgi:hypothetical protein